MYNLDDLVLALEDGDKTYTSIHLGECAECLRDFSRFSELYGSGLGVGFVERLSEALDDPETSLISFADEAGRIYDYIWNLTVDVSVLRLNHPVVSEDRFEFCDVTSSTYNFVKINYHTNFGFFDFIQRPLYEIDPNVISEMYKTFPHLIVDFPELFV